jgi:hypothetical protein
VLSTVREVDRVSLVSGFILLALGGVLILDQTDVIDLSLNLAAALLAASLGAVLLVSGFNEGDRERLMRARGWSRREPPIGDDPNR